MLTLFGIFSLLIVLAFCCLVLHGIYRLKYTRPAPEDLSIESWPSVTLIVPVAGHSPFLERNLSSLFKLDYPDYELIFVTESAEEHAAKTISCLLEQFAGTHREAQHIVSGSAEKCGQKNHNLLAGIAVGRSRVEVFAFIDSSHTAPSQWLNNLVRPLAQKTASATTGYHRILPQDNLLATLGRSVSVLILYLLQLLPGVSQPWGGNMAFCKNIFESLSIKKLLAHSVVDDVALTKLFKDAGVPVHMVRSAEIMTPLSGESLRGLIHWATRQLLYLKFIVFGTWSVAGIALCSLACSVLGSILVAFGAMSGAIPLRDALLPFFNIVILAGTCLALKDGHLKNCSYPRWLAACFATVFVMSWGHFRGWFTQWIDWHGKRYRVGARGEVLEIVRS